MCILHYNFKSEYELMLSAWGEGELREQGLIANLTEVFSEFKNKYKRKPNDISLELEDSMSFGYGFTSIDSAFVWNPVDNQFIVKMRIIVVLFQSQNGNRISLINMLLQVNCRRSTVRQTGNKSTRMTDIDDKSVVPALSDKDNGTAFRCGDCIAGKQRVINAGMKDTVMKSEVGTDRSFAWCDQF